MSKLSKETLQANYKLKGDVYIIDLSMQGLVSVRNVDSFIRVEKIQEFNLNQNYLKSIEPIFLQMSTIRYLDLSMNQIKVIENLDLPLLEDLNLSTNQITEVPMMQNAKLRKMDLSMNRIQFVAELLLPQIDELNLGGNQMTILPKMNSMPRLRILDISRNQMTSITRLMESAPYLNKLIACYNLLPGEYIDEISTVLTSLPSLEHVDLKGNILCNVQNYMLRIFQARQSLRTIDNLEINDTMIMNMQNLDKKQRYEDLVDQTKEQYTQQMLEAEQARQQIIKTLTIQRQQVDFMFDDKREATLAEMNEFFEFIKRFEAKKLKGDDIEVELDTLLKWKQKIIASENHRVQQLNSLRQQQFRNQEMALNNQLTTKTMMQKLYDIALNEPEVWRELKRKENLEEQDQEYSNPSSIGKSQQSFEQTPAGDRTNRSFRSRRN